MKPNQSHVAGLELALDALQDAHLWAGSAAIRKLIKQAQSAPAEVAQGEAVFFSQFLTAVMDAAGLVRHGRQSKELSEYLGKECIRLRLMNAPSAPPSPDAELVNLLRDVQVCRKLTSVPLKIAFMESRNMNSLSAVSAWIGEVNTRIDAKLAEVKK